jgi:thymidine kinase
MNNNIHACCGRIEVIIGCMYSGKTTEIMRKINMYKTLGKQMVIYTHAIDTRYAQSGQISTHDKTIIQAISKTRLSDIFETATYQTAEIVFIEEAQFFDDLFDTVIRAVNEDKKVVIVSGLDGDYQLQPFDQIVRLIPHAEQVIKLNALCRKCGDGTLASFSKRMVSSVERELVGSIGVYEAVCRKHF